MIPSIGFLLLSAACAPEEEEELGPHLLGTIEAYDGVVELWNNTTFYYAEKDTMVLYMSAAEGLDCEQTAGALEGNGFGASGDWDPRETQASGYCTLTVSAPSYSGSLSVELEAGEKTTDAIVSVKCWMDGEWEEGDESGSWTFSGRQWQGTPDGYSLEVEGIDGDGTWSLEMENYLGSDPEDFSGTELPGTGKVSGSGSVGWCPDFAETALFE